MDLSLFDYEFPRELVAQRPTEKRDSSRLMVLDRKRQTWGHQSFPDFVDFFRSGDLLILNDSKVLPVRLLGQTADGKKIEALLLTEAGPGGAKQTRYEIYPKRLRDIPLESIQWRVAVPPLPPYIKRPSLDDYSAEDFSRYQTLFARNPGSAAAPTSGFHFTKEILDQLKQKGVLIYFVTLHVGQDTFQPVRVEQIQDHQMHGELYSVPADTAAALLLAKKEGRPVMACGTTAVRALESWAAGESSPTHLFITPGFEFKIVDRLLTNFHQPKSTLLMLVSAFAGREFVLQAYAEAVRKKYRLFSYGDCMLIE